MYIRFYGDTDCVNVLEDWNFSQFRSEVTKNRFLKELKKQFRSEKSTNLIVTLKMSIEVLWTME